MNLAIVHEWLTNMGGSERLIINFKELFPEAPIYTTIYNPDNLDDELKNIDVRTSFLQNKRNAKTNHQKFFPFMPAAFESFDLTSYDVVLSSSTSCSKGVITRPDTMHICYCNSPMRYGWEFYYEYINNDVNSKIKKLLIKYLMNYMRVWDRASSDRVDYFIANSENVARRIWKHYRRESVVIHPAVRVKKFDVGNIDEDYFLIVSRLVAYKKVDLAIKVFNELKLPLVIIGDGGERKKLESMANDNIKFLGRQPDSVIKEYYSKCRAFVFPGEEDFGITPLEAQASGRPVIAFGKGGALETVVNEKTGIFFSDQTEEKMKEAINKFQSMTFDKNVIRKHAEGFDEEIFKQKINNYINECYDEFKKNKKWRVI